MTLDEDPIWIGGRLKLTPAEEKLNTLLLSLKSTEFMLAQTSSEMTGASNFISSRSAFEETKIFKIIRQMPKGAILHLHDVAMLDYDRLILNATYRPNCYMCVNDMTSAFMFRFALSTPPTEEGFTKWDLVENLRRAAESEEIFNQELKERMVFLPDDVKGNLKERWNKFEKIIWGTAGLIFYEEVFPDVVYEAMKWAYQDNVQYVELRTILNKAYNIKGELLSKQQCLEIYRSGITRFVADFPDFFGARIIDTYVKIITKEQALSDIKEAVDLYEKNRGFYIGVDFVGPEDFTHTLEYYKDALSYPSANHKELPFFFHAGETLLSGTDVDNNLAEAIFYKTKRIGHGYALLKHPRLMKIVKEREIAVEVNPISNQVLGLLYDIRNHPMNTLIAEDYPIVISSDDPAAWGGLPLSHDFYVAFMALSSKTAGLRLLKQFALNSFKYSALSSKEKENATKLWEFKWTQFIEKMVEQHKL